MSSIEFLLVKTFGSIVSPPGVNVVLALSALALLSSARRLGALVMFVAVGSLYAFSTGVVASALAGTLYDHPLLSPETDLSGAGAIVAPGGGGQRIDYEGFPTAGGSTLERVRYAADLHRRTGLPLLVTGGSPGPGAAPVAELMVRSLENDFGIAVRFVESRSRNTFENAAYSAVLLAEAGITRIVLVTHASHMSRAMRAFESQGLEVAPAPLRRSPVPLDVRAFLPRASALLVSASVLHEWAGLLWYRVRYGGGRAAP